MSTYGLSIVYTYNVLEIIPFFKINEPFKLLIIMILLANGSHLHNRFLNSNDYCNSDNRCLDYQNNRLRSITILLKKIIIAIGY